MTSWGDKLVGVDAQQLREQLRRETDPKAIKRITVGLLYLNGHSPADIQQLLGVHEQTVYDWLDAVAERDVDALADRPRGGSSTRLTAEQWAELTATLAASPAAAGYDEPTWTPTLVRAHIAETFGVEYSLAHMYRVMKRAGLSYQTARPRHYKADPAAQRAWRSEFKKSGPH